MPPLDEITVIALEHAVAGPLATRHLADLGARVIKVERPAVGDFSRSYDRTVKGQASYFVWLNRGKESIELNLKDHHDMSTLRSMIASADVLVQNLAPGAVERLELDAETLRADHPSLIHCSISGYGQEGPYRQKKAYDLLIQCETGLVMATGTPDNPSRVGVSIADIATGMYAYTGILTALYERERTGVGSILQVAMLDALAEWMMQPAYYAAYSRKHFPRSGAKHPSISPYGPFRTADGTIFLGIQSDREWRALCRDVIHRPDLAHDPRFAANPERVEHDEEIRGYIEAAFATRSSDDVIALLEDHGFACARMRSPENLFDHPQLVARSRWRDVESPGGTIKALLPPVTVPGRDAAMRPIPGLGEHTSRLLAEFGA